MTLAIAAALSKSTNPAIKPHSKVDHKVAVYLHRKAVTCNCCSCTVVHCRPFMSLCPPPSKQRFLQRSHLHTVIECRSPTTRAVLGRRHNGRLLLVSAVSVRHDSSQVSRCQCTAQRWRSRLTTLQTLHYINQWLCATSSTAVGHHIAISCDVES